MIVQQLPVDVQMGDAVLLPDGTVFLCNGAQIGKHTIISL